MKKITLTSIILFMLIVATLYVGSIFQSNSNSDPITNNTNVPVNTNITFNAIDISNSNFAPENTYTDTLTTDKVSKHNSKNDCYIIINNNVYDVSLYIGHHPGGTKTITSRCGDEVTGIFARIHSNRAWDLLEKYKIGTITVSKLDTTP